MFANMKGLKITLLLVMLLAYVASFAMPIMAEAAGIPTISVDPTNGTMTVTGEGFKSKDATKKSGWEGLIEKYRGFIAGISGVAAITMVVIFIFQFLKLGASAGNPQARSQALVGVLWSGVAAAGLGAVSLIVGLFYSSIGG